jgi:uncharacterized flavoprotein (TIGR03862 family)
MTDSSKQAVAVIGGGPAGLMAAEVLISSGVQVDVYDSMPSFGRKFLMAGRSGLNLTHSEPYEKFIARYGSRGRELKNHLDRFTPHDLREWAKVLGIETFVGSSGRVFPVGMKASPLLRAWLKRLQTHGVSFHTRHHWKGWSKGSLLFETPDGEYKIKPAATVLALGGASWPRLGSSAAWVGWLEQAGVKVEPLRPSNCGFDVNWSDHFREKFHGHPIKSVCLTFQDFTQRGEFVVTRTGLEGSLIYAVSSRLRDELDAKGNASFGLDLAPDSPQEKLAAALSRPRGSRTVANHLEKTVGIKGIKAGLLYEFLDRGVFSDVGKLASAIKALEIPVTATRPIEEAISSAGGVAFEELDEHLMIKKLPGVFCTGEMLDWEAPTGGYLLNACFATGRTAGEGALGWLV